MSTTYTVRQVVLSTQPVNLTTLPVIISANDPQDGSVMAGFLQTDPDTLLIVWALAQTSRF